MIKEKEKIAEEKSEKISDRIKKYIEEMDNMSDTKRFNINKIESSWSELEKFTKEVFVELNEEIIRSYNEKDIIKLKKTNTH
jgi:hypothetical protein